MTVSIPGVDYSAGRPGGAALAKAGMRFAARYLSYTSSKNLTPSEADDLAAHGVSCVVVWETAGGRAAAGRNAGIADAKEAAAQAKACGQPSGRPIYFAVDYDATPSAVVAYFQGVASVIGTARTGVYGGYKVVSYLLDHKLAAWAWQTAAWSGGHWDARAHIRQPATTLHIAGISCDHDTAYQTDYGQWMPGQPPNVEDDMAISDADADKIARAVASYSHGDDPDVHQTWATAAKQATAAAGNTKGLVAQLAALTATVTTLAKGGGLTAAEITAAAKAGADAALAELGDALTKEN